jgi:AraC-like DNA-binding protein
MSIPLQTFPHASRPVSIDVQTLEERHREWELRPHGHAFFEVIVVTRGVVASSAYAIPPGAIHDCREFGIDDGLVLRFLPDGVDPQATNGLSIVGDIPTGMLFDVFRRPMLDLTQPFALAPDAHAAALAALERMRDELQAKQRGYEFVVRGELQIVLVELARGTPSDPPASDEPHTRELLRRVFADIDAHYTERETLSAAAGRVKLSPAYLTTRMRQLTNRTYRDWVIERRMLEARRLLIVTDLPVAQIAERVGYAESESFVRRFRERHAVTPAVWREKSRSIES